MSASSVPKRHCAESTVPTLPPTSAPSGRNPPICYSLRGSSLAVLPASSWNPLISMMDYLDKHHLSQTCQYYRQIVNQQGLPGLRRIQRMLNDTADAISKRNTPALNEMAAKIRTIIPEAIFKPNAPPRTGFLHPFLPEQVSELPAVARLHDILTNRELLPSTHYSLGEHQAFNAALRGSIDSWTVVRSLMKYYGGTPFDFLSPGKRLDHIREAAGYSYQVLKYISLDQDTPFVRELIGRAALYHPDLLKTQASCIDYQRMRCGSGMTSVASVANVAEIIQDTETAVTLPFLHDDGALFPGTWEEETFEELGLRTDSRVRMVYQDWCRVTSEDVPISAFIPTWLQTDSRFIADLFANRDVRLDVLKNLSPRVLSREFWTHVANEPFSRDDMMDWVTSKMREPGALVAGGFTPGITHDIIIKLIHFFDIDDAPGSDHPLGLLYPLPHFPTVSLIWEVFLSFSNFRDRTSWLAILLGRKYPESFPFLSRLYERIFDELIDHACSQGRTSRPLPCHYKKLAFVLAITLMNISDRTVREKLITDCLNLELGRLFHVVKGFKRPRTLPPVAVLASPAAPRPSQPPHAST